MRIALQAPAGPAAPGRSCPCACRCGRPPATPAPRSEPGSSPRQRLDDCCRQSRRDRSRDPDPHLARELKLDRRHGGGAVTRIASAPPAPAQNHSPPLADPGANGRSSSTSRRLTRHIADHCTGFECRRDNRLLLLHAPPATPLGTGHTSTLAIALSLAPVQTTVFAPGLTSPINSPIARRPSAEGYDDPIASVRAENGEAHSASLQARACSPYAGLSPQSGCRRTLFYTVKLRRPPFASAGDKNRAP